MKNNRAVPFVILTLFFISGCSTLGNKFGPEESMFGGDRVTSASANQMFNSEFEGFNDEQIIHLLDPATDSKVTDSNIPSQSIEKRLNTAFYKANEYPNPELHRSQIQDRLIAASNQRCNIYTTYIKRMSTKNNAAFGTLTTALGGAGAIVTGAHTARLLAGLAGISSGVRAELNQAIFESVATSVIVPAIHKQRAEILEEIQGKRGTNGLSLEEYTVAGAIADAIKYHGACSMDAGIAFAQKSLNSFEDVGVMRFTDIQHKLNAARGASASFSVGAKFFDSLVVAENELKKFKAKLPGYQDKINLLPEQKEAPQKILNELVASSDKEGSFSKKAIELDASLKELTFNFHSAGVEDKSLRFSLLVEQQKQAKRFSEGLTKKESELINAFQKKNE